MKNMVINDVLRHFQPESANALGPPGQMDSLILNMWVVTQSVLRSGKTNWGLDESKLASILDDFHGAVYGDLVALGMTNTQLEELQSRLRQRYQEYNAAHAGFWAQEVAWERKFGGAVTRNVFGRESSDVRVVMMISIGVNEMLLSIAAVLKDFNLGQ